MRLLLHLQLGLDSGLTVFVGSLNELSKSAHEYSSGAIPRIAQLKHWCEFLWGSWGIEQTLPYPQESEAPQIKNNNNTFLNGN